VQGESHLARFFEGDYRDLGVYLAKATEVDERFHHDARELALSLVSAPSEAAREGLERLRKEGGYFVTTGQQPGLFGGPLYSLYKALSAVKLAETLEAAFGRPVLPLFWVASEDHDWDEADHTHLLDAENRLHVFRIPSQDGPQARPLYRIPLTRGLDDVLDEFIQVVPENDFSKYYIKLLRDCYPTGVTLSDGFRSLMEGLLSDLPLLFIDAASPRLKEASLSLLLQELDAAEEHEALLHRVASHLEMDGYDAQVPILEGGTNLFLEGPAGRDRVYREGGAYRLKRANVKMSSSDLRARGEADPSCITPNVLLRPVVESALLPTVSYVAGPGELAYFAQLKEYFRSHGIRMPVVFPRHSVTFLEAKVRKVLEKFHLTVEALDRPHHELAGEIAREEVPPEVRRALGEIRGAIGKGAGTLGKATQAIDPTLKGPVNNARNTAFSAFDEAERKILQAVKRQNEITLGQLEKAQQNLFPLGKPQERVLNPLHYLSRYGPDLVPALLEEFDVALRTDSA
jgi:bacillithiol biosynthesis cysteine-adding enzyme BshC